MHLHMLHLHLERMVGYIPPRMAAMGMIAALDSYVEGLPKMRRAFMAAALLLLGGFGGGVMITLFGVNEDLDLIKTQHVAMGAYIVQDKAAMAHLKADQEEAISEMTEAIQDLTCDINNVPNARCEWWIDNGRPDL